MIKTFNKNKFFTFIGLTSLFIFSSCGTTKNVPYFQDISLAEQSVLGNTTVFTEPKIQPDDIVSISIFTIDPTTSMVVNQVGTQAVNSSGGQVSALAATQATAGFLVDKNGEIDLSVVGRVKIAGLTTFEARDVLKEKASIVYKNPNVQVRFANFKVTVLGEVGRPATYTIPNEKVSVLDALGLAGDLTIFGRRENVLLIRDNNGKKEFARLNLNSTEMFTSQYFFLRQNDVLYVEPNKGKAASLNQARTQTFAVIGSALSVLVVLFTRL
ncbi:polysaccharide biosynthesis/export family protein [Pedobacter immunditicola]|uniref:polysaccharide biosynthesis/export family protein n=1 Tax=Pedobacter immunditicola TaxID=3133440 RepID=UPI0030A8C1AD